MKNLTLSNIANACGGKLYCTKTELLKIEATSVVTDSRKVTPNGIFIAVPGEKVDGHSFIPQVVEMGALAVVCEKEPTEADTPYILVDNSLIALKKIAAFYRMQLDIPVIGITGSVGKTSTKEFIAGTLGAKYNVLKTAGNFNNEIGLPLTILSIQPEHEIAVVEMGISDFGEMSRLADIAKPDTCVITNIGQCHLENLIDRDGVLQAKTEVFYYMNHRGMILLNGDDDKLLTKTKPWSRNIMRFGHSEEFQVYPTDIVNCGLMGTDVTMHFNQLEVAGQSLDTAFSETELVRGGELSVHVPLPGAHMVNNAMAAAAVALEYGLTFDEIKRGIESVEATAGRSHVIKTDDYTLIDDCYNANPVSMRAAIDLLGLANGRKVAVLGDMFELGEDEAKLHFGVGEYAAINGVDVLVCIGELAANMYEAASKRIDNVYLYPDVASGIEGLSQVLKKDDSVLLKASHGMHFENILKELVG